MDAQSGKRGFLVPAPPCHPVSHFASVLGLPWRHSPTASRVCARSPMARTRDAAMRCAKLHPRVRSVTRKVPGGLRVWRVVDVRSTDFWKGRREGKGERTAPGQEAADVGEGNWKFTERPAPGPWCRSFVSSARSRGA